MCRATIQLRSSRLPRSAAGRWPSTPFSTISQRRRARWMRPNQGITTIRSLIASAQSVANQALQSASTLVTITGTNGTALTTGTTIATTAGSSTTFKAGDVVTVSDGTTTATYTAANNDTVQTFL